MGGNAFLSHGNSFRCHGNPFQSHSAADRLVSPRVVSEARAIGAAAAWQVSNGVFFGDDRRIRTRLDEHLSAGSQR